MQETCAGGYASFHGNYLPALELVDKLLNEDLGRAVQTVVLFLSDGAPSDHNDFECQHGVQVWEVSDRRLLNAKGKPVLKSCGSASQSITCRSKIKQQVSIECCDQVRRLGDKYGRDRLVFQTVGLGPATEEFLLLQKMAQVLPRSSFQKLGLAAKNLVTMFSSLTSTLTSMRTEGADRPDKTLRRDRRQEGLSEQTRPRYVTPADGWVIYEGATFTSKKAFDGLEFVHSPLKDGATGVAIKRNFFAAGAERLAYQCIEVGPSEKKYY